jgi:hypothetical protein
MSLTDLLSESVYLYNKYGLHGLRATGENFLRGLSVRLGSVIGAFSSSPSLLNEDWDLLIVLDACRWDIMSDVSDEYDWLSPVPTRSYASSSQDWLQKTFFAGPKSTTKRLRATLSLLREPYQNDVLAETLESRDTSDIAYISGNPQSTMLDKLSFAYIKETWRYDLPHNKKTRALTDITIKYRRENPSIRTIVHYMKPHEPFKKESSNGTAWQRLQWGEYPLQELKQDYRQNLKDVLDEVEILLENTDANRVLITADHGNSYGEWGFYGHRPYLPLDGMRRIPVASTSAEDKETHNPSELEFEDEVEAKNKLRDLGYR